MSKHALIVHNVSSVKIVNKESLRFSKSSTTDWDFKGFKLITTKTECYYDSYTLKNVKKLPKYYFEKDDKIFIQ